MENSKYKSSPELLVGLLNEEINRIDNQSSRTGTNPWILLAALATVIWMIFPTIYGYQGGYLGLVLPFMTLYVFYDLIINLLSTLKPKLSNSSGKIDRFQFTNINIAGSRHAILFSLVKVASLLFMIYCLSNIYSSSLLRLLYVPYFMSALFLPVILILSYFKIPLNTAGNKKGKVVQLILILIILYCFAVGSWVLIEIALEHPPTLVAWQISGAILVAVIILGLLSSSNKENSPLLVSLIELRRDLILNRISFESAVDQADIIFSGLSISHLLQEEVEELLEHQRNISKIYHTIASEYEATKNAALKNPQDKCTLCSSLTRSVDSYLTEVEKLLDDYRKKSKKFLIRSGMLVSMTFSHEALTEVKKMNEKLLNSYTNIQESLSIVKEKANAFQTDLNCKEEIIEIAEC